MTFKRLPNGHWPKSHSIIDPKHDQRPYAWVRCSKTLSFPDTLLPDEELIHVNFGPAVYTEDCMVMDKLQSEKYRMHVEVNGDIKKVSYHKLIRRDNQGKWTVRLCHKNPKQDFIKRHFYAN